MSCRNLVTNAVMSEYWSLFAIVDPAAGIPSIRMKTSVDVIILPVSSRINLGNRTFIAENIGTKLCVIHSYNFIFCVAYQYFYILSGIYSR